MTNAFPEAEALPLESLVTLTAYAIASRVPVDADRASRLLLVMLRERVTS